MFTILLIDITLVLTGHFRTACIKTLVFRAVFVKALGCTIENKKEKSNMHPLQFIIKSTV